MIKAGISRGYINAAVGRIRRMFRWAVADELAPVAVSQALETVAGLRAGRTDAVESKPVKPVPEAFVDAVQPHVSRQVWGMIQVQLFAGMRPGEVIIMRGCDLNTSGKVWEYTPSTHKTEHHGRRRVVFLGPRAQSIVREFLKTDLSAYLFSPIDAEAERKAAKRAARKTAVQPSQVNRRKAKPKKMPGARYTRVAYANSIRRACVKADVPHWHPHQLRHNAGTTLRREVGIEAARTVLGHASADVTEIYAQRDLDAAREAAAKLG